MSSVDMTRRVRRQRHKYCKTIRPVAIHLITSSSNQLKQLNLALSPTQRPNKPHQTTSNHHDHERPRHPYRRSPGQRLQKPHRPERNPRASRRQARRRPHRRRDRRLGRTAWFVPTHPPTHPSNKPPKLTTPTEADDKNAIDQSNIISERTRGAAKSAGTYQEPGDEEGLPGPEDGTSRVAGGVH